ncbi:glycosyltransferase family 2 protein [Wenzhouxiangella sediminis]|uniref:Glycosyltransferase family 2 protein n=1 Tax=Wenzhouxiangella sediminis TaxID=1792836 RepID=A0A3E1K6D4_9GAMM|nr:glycosyltransferase family 2 protein [Wenzhouxiangella sediminis]RFF29582.1 glycosyltransferase family 2 protein [Wenzhouxiangella sediminis]
MNLTAIILTLNEEQHLPRCLESLRDVTDSVLVADSFSSDRTVAIAEAQGARVVQHPFVNHAQQFNWALAQLDPCTDWVLRIDADEYLTPELAVEIRERLEGLRSEIDGVLLERRMTFQGRMIRFGGVFPVQVLRLFRYGRGECENRWMDEHIRVSGETIRFVSELIDDNLNSLTWWIDKHNRYANREAVEMLNLEYGFMPSGSATNLRSGTQAGLKRWLKERVYANLPGGARATFYFLYRYILRAGFLDGRAGFAFHFLQGFWYRYLVDAKVAEVRRHMANTGSPIQKSILAVLEIDVGHRPKSE